MADPYTINFLDFAEVFYLNNKLVQQMHKEKPKR